MSDYILALKWPKTVSPGDEWYIENAICVDTSTGAVRVDFLFEDDIYVIGAHSIKKNSFLFPKALNKKSFGLKYIVSKESLIKSEKCMAFIVYHRRLVTWRIILIATLTFSSMLPVILQLFKYSSLTVSLGFGNFLVTTFPLGIIISLVFSWKKVLKVISALVSKDIIQDNIKFELGDSLRSIRITDSMTSRGDNTWVANDRGV
ncbi:MAG: hypothetical protein AB7N91_31335 [Candidatus Tectimicrobiota bacterium]